MTYKKQILEVLLTMRADAISNTELRDRVGEKKDNGKSRKTFQFDDKTNLFIFLHEICALERAIELRS